MQIYDDQRFLGSNADELAKIILTGNTAERWDIETEIFSDLMIQHMHITSDSVLLDFGTGIGRIAKALIDKTGCQIIGVDISPDMLRESFSYVSDNKFTAMSFQTFEYLSKTGKILFDAAYSIWVLQHCNFEPAYSSILRVLPKGAEFFIANTKSRCVPIKPTGWADDGLDIRARLNEDFEQIHDATHEISAHMPSDHDGLIFCDFMRKKV